MKKWLVLVCGLGLFSACGEPISEELGAYIEAQQALAGDDVEKAQAALAKMAEVSQGKTAELARQAAQGRNMVAVRASFKPLSEVIIEGEVPDGYGVVYCSMAFNDRGARWVQKEGKIANPYYGASMLRCGGFEKK